MGLVLTELLVYQERQMIKQVQSNMMGEVQDVKSSLVKMTFKMKTNGLIEISQLVKKVNRILS